MANKYERKLKKKTKENKQSFEEFYLKNSHRIVIPIQDFSCNKKEKTPHKPFVLRRGYNALILAVFVLVLVFSIFPFLPSDIEPPVPPIEYNDVNTDLVKSNLEELKLFLKNADIEILSDLYIQCGKAKDTEEPVYFIAVGYYEAENYFELSMTYVILDNYTPSQAGDYDGLKNRTELAEDYIITYEYKDIKDSMGINLYRYFAKVDYGKSSFYIELLCYLDEGIEEFLTTLFI